MSIARVRAYHARIDKLRKTSGSATELQLRAAFQELLTGWADAENMVLIAEQPIDRGPGKGRIPDATIRHDIRVVHGYWEAKDEKDDLEEEIETKRRHGYPTTNIIFEDSQTAVLYQHNRETIRCAMANPEALKELLDQFFAFEPPVIEDWRVAIRQFQEDLPHILDELRARIDAAYTDNADFRAQADTFLVHARETVNPNIGEPDVREMLIQHILTEEIFTSVFSNAGFHHENNIAQQLYALERLFLRGAAKQAMLHAIEPYYNAIKKAALEIDSHAEKQTFLKIVYESFYKTYNPKAADRLGVIYTPNEIVRFMINGADWLCREHFGKGLIDEGVEILDPATGTGTFICELLEFFRGQPELHRKYKEEMHANEVAILPYYVANLNIEATYAEITGQFAEFENLVFADTLDMNEGLGIRRGQQLSFLGRFTDENIERIRRQDARKISVVIGNPPYNANQQNENDNNKNREYPNMDTRVKNTFVKLSTAQKTKVYDMYSRFYRWAFDRIADEGIVCFVTNRSFIDSRTFDGFRRYVTENFGDIYLADLGGDVRANPKLSGTTHNVFGIQTGVTIGFFVKGGKGKGLHYVRRPEDERAQDKLDWLARSEASGLNWEAITPSKRGNWVNQVENEWDDLLPVADKKTKAAKVKGQERAIFKTFTLGIATNRDAWVYDPLNKCVSAKGRFQIEYFNEYLSEAVKVEVGDRYNDFFSQGIKWTRSLKRMAHAGSRIEKAEWLPVVTSNYRPFTKRFLFARPEFIEMLNNTGECFKHGDAENPSMVFMGDSTGKPYFAFAIDRILDLNYVSPASGGSQTLPRYRYTPTGERIDNITDWALNKFIRNYGKRAGVSKDAIFHYVYACLHDPVWREIYAINLRREFPRIPFQDDFARWAKWGERLMDLHINYETVDPWPVTRTDVTDKKSRAAGVPLPVKLKPHPEDGSIEIDSETTLTGFPPEAWNYKLGNRSGLDWVLDQHKEKNVRDATVEAWLQDNPDCRYRFADHKERVIDLLARVARVSVETLETVDAMRAAPRSWLTDPRSDH